MKAAEKTGECSIGRSHSTPCSRSTLASHSGCLVHEALQLLSNRFDEIALLRSFSDVIRLSAYAHDQSGIEKRRALEKISLCGGIDPDDHNTKDAVCDMNLLPWLKSADIRDYLFHELALLHGKA